MHKAANDPDFAREHGISQSVAREFVGAGERSRERRRKRQSASTARQSR